MKTFITLHRQKDITEAQTQHNTDKNKSSLRLVVYKLQKYITSLFY